MFVAGLESDYLFEKQILCYFSACLGVYPLETAGLWKIEGVFEFKIDPLGD